MWYICLLVIQIKKYLLQNGEDEMKKKQPQPNLYRMPPGIDFGGNCLGSISRDIPETYIGRTLRRWTHYHVEIWKINQRRPIR